jgi:uncharacterized protein
MELELGGNQMELSARKCLWWPAVKSLLIADLHLGKAAHFRKHALPLPGNAHSADYTRLADVIHHYQPERLIILGDLFHSDLNAEWEQFSSFRGLYKQLTWTLIGGNHDILHNALYREAGLEYIDECLNLHGLLLRHHPAEDNKPSVCGHMHPGVVLQGKGRQQLRLPCFYLSNHQLILPAFGALTGLSLVVTGKKNSRIFAVGEGRLYEIQNRS